MQLPARIKSELPPHVDAVLVARLAREVVMAIRPIQRILEDLRLTPAHFIAIQNLGYYCRVVEEFSMEWNKITNTQERLKLISAVMLEEGMPRLGSHMIDKNVSPAVAVDTGKFFAKMAGVGEGVRQDQLGPTAEKFTITINLGEDTKLQFTKDVSPQPTAIEQDEEPMMVEPSEEDNVS